MAGNAYQFIYVSCKKIIIFKNSQYTYISKYTHYQIPLSPGACGIFYHDTRYVVNNNSNEQNKYVYRDEIHIENAACSQKMEPPQVVWQQKIKNSYNGEKK